MKKKVNVVYTVEFETTIEVDTDLPQCEMYFDEYFYDDIDLNKSSFPESEDNELEDKILDVKEILLSNINIAKNESSDYRKKSLRIINFEVL